MSRRVVIDKTLEFSFPEEWKYCVYENAPRYTSIRKKISNITCADLLLLNTSDKILFIIEAKDYEKPSPKADEQIRKRIKEELIQDLAKKCFDTIAGLTCSKLCGDTDLRHFYRALLDPAFKKNYVAFVELGRFRNEKMGTGKNMQVNLLQRLQNTLQPVCCNKKTLCDIKTIPSGYGWSVSRIA